MNVEKIKPYGYRPSMIQKLAILSAIPKNLDEKVIIHHVLKETYTSMTVQIERRIGNKCTFERVVI
jgi:hypothetical protein